MSADELAGFRHRLAAEPQMHEEIQARLSTFTRESSQPLSGVSITQEMLEGYIDGTLDANDVELVESVMSDEPLIRAQITELRLNRIETEALATSQYIRHPNSRFKFPRALWAGGVCVACVAAFLVFVKLSGRVPVGTSPESSVAALDRIQVPEAIAVLTNTNASTSLGSSRESMRPDATAVESDRPTLVWRQMPNAVSYHVEVRDKNARQAFSAETKSCEIQLGQSLSRGPIYSWTVTGLDEKGDPTDFGANPARFIILTGPQVADFQRERHSAKGIDLVAVDVKFGLLDHAAADLEGAVGTTADPAIKSAEGRLLARIHQTTH